MEPCALLDPKAFYVGAELAGELPPIALAIGCAFLSGARGQMREHSRVAAGPHILNELQEACIQQPLGQWHEANGRFVFDLLPATALPQEDPPYAGDLPHVVERQIETILKTWPDFSAQALNRSGSKIVASSAAVRATRVQVSGGIEFRLKPLERVLAQLVGVDQ